MNKSAKTAPAKAEGENTAAVTAKVTTKKPDAKSAGFSVYIGPTILGVIQSGHVYDVSREDALKALAPIVKERPLIAALVVDGATLADDRIKVKTPGNLLFVQYKRLASGEIK